MSQVMICELVLPENDPVALQTTLRTAAMALTSVGRHPHIPTLWDAFSGRGRNFFVFESMQGESLLNRMRRTGRAMPEQDVIECCLQMTEVLELLAQQSPPLIHGLIRPEHILVGRTGSQYMLTNFSVVLAGGATQFVSGIDRARLSPYVASEFVRGVIDVRSDLYALMATAYHVVSGSMPTGVSGSIPQAQRLNPNISAQFDAILGRGLRPIASQRYQRPSELRQDLLAMRSVSGNLVPGSAGQGLGQPLSRVADSAEKGQKFEPAAAPPVPDSVAQALQSLAPDDDENQRLLLPRPEELPPMEERNHLLHAAIWLGAIAVCLVLVIVFSRGFYP
jgi:serine/threonine protein kinase